MYDNMNANNSSQFGKEDELLILIGIYLVQIFLQLLKYKINKK